MQYHPSPWTCYRRGIRQSIQERRIAIRNVQRLATGSHGRRVWLERAVTGNLAVDRYIYVTGNHAVDKDKNMNRLSMLGWAGHPRLDGAGRSTVVHTCQSVAPLMPQVVAAWLIPVVRGWSASVPRQNAMIGGDQVVHGRYQVEYGGHANC